MSLLIENEMESTVANGFNLKQRVQMYRQLDQNRQELVESLADEVQNLQALLHTARADLEDEQNTRRNYRRRAEEAETAMSRNQFVLVLVDADGYIFKNAFLKDASQAGGANAAHCLYDEVKHYVQANNVVSDASNIEVVVNVYANAQGLASALHRAGMLPNPNLLRTFFCSFSQSHSMFNFVDCGPGKERVDAKLRDAYRFYAYNAHCKHIFLACCHDNGYVAELNKYAHDEIVAPKTTLLQATPPAREYAKLKFPVARFGTVFETSPLIAREEDSFIKPTRELSIQNHTNTDLAHYDNGVSATDHSVSYSSVATPPAFTPALPPTRQQTISSMQSSTKTPSPAPLSATTTENTRPANEIIGDPQKGIPINRAGQRIDRRMRQPTIKEQERFEARIRYRKLCNEYHLRDNCYQYNCKYDHDELDKEMLNTLRYVARRIPCSTGMKCRRADCYYGHQCPWGNNECANPKCGFLKNGLHDITDFEIAKFVPASPA